MRFLFVIKERVVHPQLFGALRKACALERGDARMVKDVVAVKLDRLLREAVAKVPFYRRLAESGAIDGSNPRIEQFPVIGKKDIRGHELDFVADGYNVSRLSRTRTSGSTGEPFVFYRGRHEWDDSYACLWRGLFRLGIRMGDRRAFVKGVDERPDVSRGARFWRRLYELANRCIVIDAHFLSRSEDNVLEAISRLRRYRPAYLHGYVSSIDLLAATAERCGIRLDDIGVKAVVTESEKLYDHQRERIARVFGCTVAGNYGCVEFGMVAQPDKDGNMCLNEDHVYAEVDEDGSAIFTNLDAHAFPFIRFKNGDAITFRDRKKSSLPFMEIERVDGRMTDAIKLPGGGSLQGFVVMYPVSKHSGLMKAYQIYQPSRDRLVIRIVPVEPVFDEQVKEQILREMAEIVGEGIAIDFEFPVEIPLSRRGKRLFIWSEAKE